MKYLIVTSHPYDKSFNAAVAKNLESEAKKKGYEVEILELIKDNFNPTMTSEDLRLFSKGLSNDPMVQVYQKKIKEADVIVFPFPIWWGSMPAILKGFCDKVLLPGFAYTYGAKGEMVGALTSKKAIVITTMQMPTEVFNNYFNNPVDGAFIKDTLQTCGIEVTDYVQIDQIVTGGRDYTEQKMKEIINLIK